MKTFIFRDLMRSLVAAVILTMAMSTAFGQEYRTGTGKACNNRKAAARATYVVQSKGYTGINYRGCQVIGNDSHVFGFIKRNRSRVGNRHKSLFDWHPRARRVSRRLVVN